MPGNRSAWSGTQRRSHSQIDSSTGHSDRLRGGHQVLGPGRVRLVDAAVQQAVARSATAAGAVSTEFEIGSRVLNSPYRVAPSRAC